MEKELTNRQSNENFEIFKEIANQEESQEDKEFNERLSNLNLNELLKFIDDVYYLFPSRFEYMRQAFNNELMKRGIEALIEKELE